MGILILITFMPYATSLSRQLFMRAGIPDEMIKMSVEAVWAAFVLIAISEFGDKTQLATISLAAQYRKPWIVFLAATLALTAASVVGVAASSLLARVLPFTLISKIAGILFIAFGILTSFGKVSWQGRDMEVKAFWGALSLIFLSELGDKTQLAVIALAAKMQAPLEIILGVTAAFLVLSGVAVVVGEKLARVVPMRWVKRGAGILFIVIGALILLNLL